MSGERQGWLLSTETREESTPDNDQSAGVVTVSTVAVRLRSSTVLIGPEVQIYWHIPANGEPYLVVEVDTEDANHIHAARVRVIYDADMDPDEDPR